MVFFLAVFINSVLLKEDITRGHFAYILMETVLHAFFSLWHYFVSKTRMVTKFVHNYLLFILDRCNISEYGVKKKGCAGVLIMIRKHSFWSLKSILFNTGV